jgi:transcriptional regulator with XRE-family HTH domain
MVSHVKKQKQRQFIREWRKFRNLTQERLADRMGVTRGYVSQVETGLRRYDQHFLEAAADALSCEPADLIMRDPTKPSAIWSIWDRIPPTQREQAARVLETFVVKKTGTDF